MSESDLKLNTSNSDGLYKLQSNEKESDSVSQSDAGKAKSPQENQKVDAALKLNIEKIGSQDEINLPSSLKKTVSSPRDRQEMEKKKISFKIDKVDNSQETVDFERATEPIDENQP